MLRIQVSYNFIYEAESYVNVRIKDRINCHASMKTLGMERKQSFKIHHKAALKLWPISQDKHLDSGRQLLS